MRMATPVLMALSVGLFHPAVTSAEITGLGRGDLPERLVLSGSPSVKANLTSLLYLRRAVGNLDIMTQGTTSTYEAYFHVPVAFAEQAPITVEVESPHLIDYRFLQLDPTNVMVVARMERAAPTYINWTSWVLVKRNIYADLPGFVPIPTLEELPDSVRPWLATTDCAQLDAPIVQQVAAQVRGTTTNLMELADNICDYCYAMPWTFGHTPLAFDAVYALNWGNSCTGHAHAGAALFRANGVPARSLLNIPIWYSGYMDMHWIIEYFVPQYGWVRMETSTGANPAYPQQEIVTLACRPEDEFPLFYPCGIEGAWHTSDPAMSMFDPDWAGAHHSDHVLEVAADEQQIEHALALTRAVFGHYTAGWGITLMPQQQASFQEAWNHQLQAKASLQAADLGGYISEMESALAGYEAVALADTVTVFRDDFENGANGWTHGGVLDEWELGAPTYGPIASHSGSSCWGTDLDGTYENDSNCWLLSPEIDLSGLACAYLGFWVWNWVEDQTQGYVHDPLWMDITTDGVNFVPICSWMGGVNDDPSIPDVGGWTHLALDLQPYLGHAVRIRFRFQSNASVVEPGSYLDDVLVYGREFDASGVADYPGYSCPIVRAVNSPNPFGSETSIAYDIPANARVRLAVYDIQGREIRRLVDHEEVGGHHVATWDGCDLRGNTLGPGLYFCRLESAGASCTCRLVRLR